MSFQKSRVKKERNGKTKMVEMCSRQATKSKKERFVNATRVLKKKWEYIYIYIYTYKYKNKIKYMLKENDRTLVKNAWKP